MSQSSKISREDLYEQVWTTPINKLAEKFGVSGSYLARVCRALNVPRPPVGYWQQLAVGRAKPRPKLPNALPGDQLSWSKNTPLAEPVRVPVRRKVDDAAKAKKLPPVRHPLLVGAESHFRKSRKVDEGEFLKPYKYLLPDIVASEGCLNQALDIAGQVYLALDRAGHRVVLAPPDQQLHRVHIEEREVPGKDRHYGRYGFGGIWSPQRPTIAYFGDTPIGISLTELTERITLRYLNGNYVREDSKEVKAAKSWQMTHSWTTEKDVPCGRFRLVAYSPFHGVDWVETWQETKTTSLRPMVPEIVRKLEGAIDELQRLKSLADEASVRRRREWEEAEEHRRREEDRRQVAQALSDSRKQLADIMEKWAAAMTVERFFEDAERRLENVAGERRARFQERLALARAMLGTLDPLDFLKEWRAPEERYKSKYSDG